jgi:hypothetical protein
LAGTNVDDNLADPDYIAQTYLQLHRQHRSTWAFEVVLRPWVEKMVTRAVVRVRYFRQFGKCPPGLSEISKNLFAQTERQRDQSLIR